jgi:hypothetical protein
LKIKQRVRAAKAALHRARAENGCFLPRDAEQKQAQLEKKETPLESKTATDLRDAMAGCELPEILNGGEELGGKPVLLPATWDISEKAPVDSMHRAAFHDPRVFVLLVQIAVREFGKGPGITTADLMGQMVVVNQATCKALYRNLTIAWELGLIGRFPMGSANTNGWRVTTEGKRFLLTGIKARQKLMKVSGRSLEDVCLLISTDEVDDLEEDMKEWVRRVEAGGQEFDREVKAKGQPRAVRSIVVSHAEVAKAIEVGAMRMARDLQAQVAGPWAGLLIASKAA